MNRLKDSHDQKGPGCLTILLGFIIGGPLGAVLGVISAAVYASATKMSTFEGASGYFVVFFGGPVGAIVGCILGVLIALKIRR